MFRTLTTSRLSSTVAGFALGTAGVLSYTFSTSRTLRNDTAGVLSPNEWVPLKLQSSKALSRDTKELVFNFDSDKTLGGKTAYCVLFRFMKDGKPVIRPYTPVSDPNNKGTAAFVIKKYPNGAMGTHVFDLKPGQTIEIQGPIPKYPLAENQHKKITLIGGGTGITPLYQVLYHVATNPKDKTEVQLLYGSKTPEDILLKNEIDKLVAKNPKQFKVTYFVDNTNGASNVQSGYVTKDVLSRVIDPSTPNQKVFVCGPPPFMKSISGPKTSPKDQGPLTGALAELGLSSDTVFKF